MFNTAFANLQPSEDAPHPDGYECESVILRNTRGHGEKSPFIVTCPHAGILIPEHVLSTLAVSPADVLSRGDRYTDWLTVNTPNFGGRQIISKIAPTILNVGRAETSLDAKDIRGGAGDLVTTLDKYTEGGISQGVVAFKTLYNGKALYKPGQEPDANEIKNRLLQYYHPFHATVDSHVEDVVDKHGYALVFDIHSAPSTGTHADVDHGQPRPDLIFSNNSDVYGASVDQVLLAELMDLAREHGLSSNMNHPYRGGFVTQTYGANGPKGDKDFIEAFQVEFNRESMGVDEQTLELADAAKFVSVQTFTNAMLNHVAQYASMKAEASHG